MFTGMCLSELIAMADNAIALSKMKKLTIIDDLTYASYKAQREQFPGTSPERWSKLFPHAAEMEKIYQFQKALPKHCEASIRTNGDGTEAVECGKDCINGSRLCKEHYDEELI